MSLDIYDGFDTGRNELGSGGSLAKIACLSALFLHFIMT